MNMSSEYIKVTYKQNGELNWNMVVSLLLLTPSRLPPSSIHGDAHEEASFHNPKKTEDLMLWDLSF